MNKIFSVGFFWVILATAWGCSSSGQPSETEAPQFADAQLAAFVQKFPVMPQDSLTHRTTGLTQIPTPEVEAHLQKGFAAWLAQNNWQEDSLFNNLSWQGTYTQQNYAALISYQLGKNSQQPALEGEEPTVPQFYYLAQQPSAEGVWLFVQVNRKNPLMEVIDYSLMAVFINPQGAWQQVFYTYLDSQGPDGGNTTVLVPEGENWRVNTLGYGCGGMAPAGDGCMTVCTNQLVTFGKMGTLTQKEATYCLLDGAFYDAAKKELIWVVTEPNEQNVLVAYTAGWVPAYNEIEGIRYVSNLPNPEGFKQLKVSDVNQNALTCKVQFAGSNTTYTLTISPDGKTLTSQGSDGTAAQTFRRLEGY